MANLLDARGGTAPSHLSAQPGDAVSEVGALGLELLDALVLGLVGCDPESCRRLQLFELVVTWIGHFVSSLATWTT